MTWTQRHDAPRLQVLLSELREHGRLELGCSVAGVGVRTMQRLRNRDADFAEAVRAAFRCWLESRSSPGRSRHRYRYRARTGPPIR